MKDWQGNEIKVGDTVLKIMVRDVLYEGVKSLFVFDAVSNDSKILNTCVLPRQHLWKVVFETLVLDIEDPEKFQIVVYASKSKIPINHLAINLSSGGFFSQNYIIAIKGVSDSREEYQAWELTQLEKD